MYDNSLFEYQKFTEPNLLSVFIQPNSIYCGNNLAEIKLPEKCHLLGVSRDGNVILGKDNPTIYSGDYILAIAINPMMIPTLKVTLKKTHPLYYSPNNCLLAERDILSNTDNLIDANTLTNSHLQ
ncbi:TrkA C-terminal domain-containing protein [Calothrix sp. PCC 7507]|uniref:TrkA C-terminal domain-containing protein n=1 Tax=Calothrix sp. PCC 7507 TaxID=99598 RepID=UPI00029F145B|nr:TrkA C-terminal domain-containing protein [Calothrix sp. PCC 7507]AFY32014.1 TrkA-C domain protein [Calothrix sp. PCC 7507]